MTGGALEMQGLTNILRMCPMVRHLDVSYTPMTKTTSNEHGRGALVLMAAKRLRASPLQNEEERKRKQKLAEKEAKLTFSGLAQLKKKQNSEVSHLKSIVGWTVDKKLERRETWWEKYTIINRACLRIQLGWNIFWKWTTEKRGATSLQKLRRGYLVRIRYWRKKERARQKKQLKEARQLMQKVGHGYVGRSKFKKKKVQMNSMNLLFAKQMTTRIEFSFATWRRNSKITHAADIIRKRIWDRARLQRMERTIDRWLDGINLQVYAVIKIQTIVRIILSKREHRRRFIGRYSSEWRACIA